MDMFIRCSLLHGLIPSVVGSLQDVKSVVLCKELVYNLLTYKVFTELHPP